MSVVDNKICIEKLTFPYVFSTINFNMEKKENLSDKEEKEVCDKIFDA